MSQVGIEGVCTVSMQEFARAVAVLEKVADSAPGAARWAGVRLWREGERLCLGATSRAALVILRLSPSSWGGVADGWEGEVQLEQLEPLRRWCRAEPIRKATLVSLDQNGEALLFRRTPAGPGDDCGTFPAFGSEAFRAGWAPDLRSIQDTFVRAAVESTEGEFPVVRGELLTVCVDAAPLLAERVLMRPFRGRDGSKEISGMIASSADRFLAIAAGTTEAFDLAPWLHGAEVKVPE